MASVSNSGVSIKPIVIANWKMHSSRRESRNFANNFYSLVSENKKLACDIVICPPVTLISELRDVLYESAISLGGQDNHYEVSGPYTGDISATMLVDVGCSYVIIGHSENRREGDTNQLIKKKINFALNQKLNIIFCIGETLAEKIKHKTFLILRNQIKNTIQKKYDLNKIIIAYEPIWSIGTGKIPKAPELKKTFKFIKNEFKKNFKTKTLPVVLYGGSVNGSNIVLFSSISEIDGFLIGGASKSSKKFIDIIKNYYK